MATDKVTQENIDSLVEVLCQKQEYGAASKIIEDFVHEQDSLDNVEIAYNYAWKNCDLINKHIQYFIEEGMTIEKFYSYWKRLCLFGVSTERNKDVIEIFLLFLPQMEKIAPQVIPDFAHTVSYAWPHYTDEDYRDSVIVLQKALDIIKGEEPNTSNVQKYVAMSKRFFWNRKSNSYNGTVLNQDKMGDCDVWFQKNKSYLDSLDWNTYGNSVIDYYLNYCYYLQIRACSYSEQKDYYKAIELHNLALFWLNRIPEKNDSVKIHIAQNTSYISYNYSMLKELSKGKEFMNEAYNVLRTCSYPDSTHDEFYNNTYCSILNTISLGFYRINNFELAKNIRLESLNIKKEFGIPATIMDTTILMLYCQKDTFPIFSLGEELERNHQFDDPSMFDVYGYIGAAYSQLMHQAIQNGSHSNVLYYDSCAISYFKKAEECIVKQKKIF
ncbi:MAG: hypothetical protein E7070_05625 [Bacteroidales bacterium]|nr:hypothetical protein [Bacteroidales bacterium]